MREIVALAMLCGIALTAPQPALAWGDEAHEIVALLADHYLDPAVHDQVAAMLAAGTDKLTRHDIASESAGEARVWQTGAPENWSQQAYELARDHAYGKLPPPDPKGVYHLDSVYVDDATGVVALQLHKAGLRLAGILNKALAPKL